MFLFQERSPLCTIPINTLISRIFFKQHKPSILVLFNTLLISTKQRANIVEKVCFNGQGKEIIIRERCSYHPLEKWTSQPIFIDHMKITRPLSSRNQKNQRCMWMDCQWKDF